MNEVTMYGNDQCKYCNLAESLLLQKAVLPFYGQGFQSKASHEIHSAFDQTKGHHKRHQ